MMNQEQRNSIFYTSILYICGFMLFLEWLYPLQEITDTNNIMIFILYGIFCFSLSLFQIKWWISFILKGTALFIIIDSLFLDPTFLSPMWFEQLFLDISYNVQALFAQTWYDLTPLFRSVLFLLLIWLMSYLLHYWFVVMKRILLFVLLTFIYLTILDTFTAYNGGFAIFRTFIVAFIALGIANFMKELDRESIPFTWVKKSPVWILPLILTVLFSSVVGFAAPKFDPQWPDPVPFITSTAENAGSSGNNSLIQKVGYGEDDSRLGGSFVQDYTPVFQATAEQNHYWRIETKDVYTGKGWEFSGSPHYIPFEKIPPMYDDSVDSQKLQATVKFLGNHSFDKLLQPYGFKELDPKIAEAFVDARSEAIQLRNDDYELMDNMETYTINYDYPTFDITALREASGQADPYDSYLQLPDSLPERVGELAQEITADKENRYDKAKAIEQYFSSNGFTYQTTEVPVPKKHQDYVDQFLFESQAGYCDNFSTSMVVLLRTLDIPARWAKGFTGGELIDKQSGNNLYEVTNANAHSWVEVYFPEIGWVPFEPTQGFSNLADFQTSIDNTGMQTDDEQEQQQQEEQELPEQEEQAKEQPEVEPAGASPEEIKVTMKWEYVIIPILLVVIMVYIGYRTRYHWQTWFLKRKVSSNWNARNYQIAYHYLLKLLAHNGNGKLPDETLREYAMKIDRKYETNEMRKLTYHYEELLYREQNEQAPKQELAQLWKNLIKRILA